LILTTGRFDPEQIMSLIQKHQVTAWSGVPTMISRVTNSPTISSYDLSSVKSVGVGGAPLPPVVLERAAHAFPLAEQRITTNYGLSEAAGIVASASGADVLSHPGTSGRPLPAVELMIDQRPGSTGEILIRSAGLMSGYWNTEESPIDEEGWLHSGDIGYLDDDGFLYVVDRSKDIIIRGGENIASAHVEAALLTHVDVAGVAVVGVPHPDLGEEVGALVQQYPGCQLAPSALRRHLDGVVANFEIPSKWWIGNEPLPVTPTGKVDKSAALRIWTLHALPVDSSAYEVGR